MKLPKVGIIYLTFATPEWQRDIDRAFHSLEHVTYPKDRVEIICVESRSSAGRVKEWFEQAWMPKSEKELSRLHYVFRDEQIGFSGNNNIGFEKAVELGCDYVYLLNEDTEVEPDFLLQAVQRAEADPAIAYVQSLILLGDRRDQVNTVGNAFHILGFGYSNGYLWTRERAQRCLREEQTKNPDLSIGYFSGAGVLGRVSLLRACGLFDAKFFSYHEDTDASLMARSRGYKVVIEPSSVIYHYYTFNKTQLKKNFWSERNRWVLVLSYYSWWTIIVLSPLFLIMELALILFSFRGGWWQEKWNAYKEFGKPEFREWIRQRRRAIQVKRCVGDRELLSFAVATIDFQEDGVKNPVLTYLGNPLMRAYWKIASHLL